MKIVGSKPALLARLSDLVERDVFSTVEIAQASMFPLLDFPYAYRNFVSDVSVAEDSFTSDFSAQVLAVGSLSTTNIARFARGVWRFRWTVIYRSDFDSFVTSGIALQFNPSADRLLNSTPSIGTFIFQCERLFSFEASTEQLVATLGATGAAQTHKYTLSFAAERLL